MKIENILQIAKDLKASDIHITAGVPPKVRVNGQLVNLEMERLMPKDTEELILPLMNVQQRQTFEEKGEVDFSYAMADMGRYRVNVFRQRGSMAAYRGNRTAASGAAGTACIGCRIIQEEERTGSGNRADRKW